MRVLFLSPAYPPFPGGGERYVRSLALELVRRGHAVTVVTGGGVRETDFWQGCQGDGQRKVENLDGIAIYRCPIAAFPGGRAGLLAWRKGMVVLSALPVLGRQVCLRKMAEWIPPLQGLDAVLAGAGAFDLIHGFNLSWEAAALAGRRLALARGIPYFVTPFAHLGTGDDDRVARNSTMLHQMELLRQAAGVLTLTSVEAEGLVRWGVAAERVAAIGCGLDPLPAVIPPVEDVFRRYGLTGPVVLFVGRASYDKGAIHAAEAVLQLNAGGIAVQLVLAGQLSPEFQRFYERLDGAGRSRIVPLGVISEEDKHALLEGCRVFVLPSRTDSFGIVFLEAWAHGRPVIGARAGGIPGVIDEHENGLLVSFGEPAALAEALAGLLKDPQRAAVLGRKGAEKTAKVYSWEAVGARVSEIYRRVTG